MPGSAFTPAAAEVGSMRPVEVQNLRVSSVLWIFIAVPGNNTEVSWVTWLSNHSCGMWFNVFSFSSFPTEISIAAIQILQFHVIYQCNRKFLIALCALFFSEIIAGMAVKRYIAYMLQATIKPMPLKGCMISDDVKPAWALWFPGLAFECLIFLLSFIKVVQEARLRIKTPRLMFLLLRDSSIYFGCTVSLSVAKIIVWTAARHPSLFLMVFPSVHQRFSPSRCNHSIFSGSTLWYLHS
ncbi:hypothetical protein B0H21DRAFT_735608 [Amylocystis lapponica]|nr:hypothetical protein B0H21DRAFT_735608 [Amylocystis lapponica]